MRALLWAWLAAAPLLAVDGKIVNQTTGKPQAGATVTLYKMTREGPEALESVKSGADGAFAIASSGAAMPGGPQLVQVAYDGVTYNQMIPPGRPSTGLEIPVYQTSKSQGSSRAVNHMLLLEPQGGKLSVRESYFFLNDGKTTWNDPDRGTLRFQLPAEPEGKIEINCTAPQGMPIRRAPDKAGEALTWKLDFPIKPGETRIDLAYTLPDATSFKTKFLVKADQVMIATPNGVKLRGEGLEDKGKEPRTQASIFEISRPDVDLKIEGAGELAPSGGGAAAGEGESRGPSISQVNPRIYDRLYVVLGLAFGIIGLGFVLLYRAGEPKR